MKTTLKKGDKVILAIGTDRYDETVQKVSAAGIVTVDGKRFKLDETKDEGRAKRAYDRYDGMGDDRSYMIYDNRAGKMEAYLDPSF